MDPMGYLLAGTALGASVATAVGSMAALAFGRRRSTEDLLDLEGPESADPVAREYKRHLRDLGDLLRTLDEETRSDRALREELRKQVLTRYRATLDELLSERRPARRAAAAETASGTGSGTGTSARTGQRGRAAMPDARASQPGGSQSGSGPESGRRGA